MHAHSTPTVVFQHPAAGHLGLRYWVGWTSILAQCSFVYALPVNKYLDAAIR